MGDIPIRVHLGSRGSDHPFPMRTALYPHLSLAPDPPSSRATSSLRPCCLSFTSYLAYKYIFLLHPSPSSGIYSCDNPPPLAKYLHPRRHRSGPTSFCVLVSISIVSHVLRHSPILLSHSLFQGIEYFAHELATGILLHIHYAIHCCNFFSICHESSNQ